MNTRLLLSLALLPAYMVLAVPAAHAQMPAPVGAQPAPDGTIAYTQKPEGVTVDYHTAPKTFDLTLTAKPVITACGRLTDMPVKVAYDIEAVDITVGDYQLIRQLGTDAKECGTTYKAAIAHVALTREDLNRYQVKRIRFWYGHSLDSFLVLPSAGKIVVKGPYAPKLFKIGTELATGKVDTSRKATTSLVPLDTAAENPDRLVVLTTGDKERDRAQKDAILTLAQERGLVPANGENTFMDLGGQFYLQLRYVPQLSIGKITADGAKTSVIARRVK